MKKINIVKMILDTIMVVVFMLLYNKRVITGPSFHEIAGLCIGGVSILHILLNRRWVQQVTKNIFSKKLSGKTRFGYFINVLLLFSVFYIIISGIFISQVLFTKLNVGNYEFFQRTHIAVAYGTLMLFGVHVGLHWKWIMSMMKKLFRVNRLHTAIRVIANIAATGVLVLGLYNMNTVNYFNRVTAIFLNPGGESADFQARDWGSSNNSNGQTSHSAASVGKNQAAKNQTTGSHSGSSLEVQNASGQSSNSEVKRAWPIQSSSGGNHFNHSGGNTGILQVLQTYLSIIGVFAIIVYYLEKLLTRRKYAALGKARQVA